MQDTGYGIRDKTPQAKTRGWNAAPEALILHLESLHPASAAFLIEHPVSSIKIQG
jgi:hypothetical protein